MTYPFITTIYEKAIFTRWISLLCKKYDMELSLFNYYQSELLQVYQFQTLLPILLQVYQEFDAHWRSELVRKILGTFVVWDHNGVMHLHQNHLTIQCLCHPHIQHMAAGYFLAAVSPSISWKWDHKRPTVLRSIPLPKDVHENLAIYVVHPDSV